MANTNGNSLTKWSDLPKDLLYLILAKMSPISIYNSKGVCSSWRSTVKAYISSPFYITLHKVPWLMIFPEQEKDMFSFYSLDEKRVYKRMDRPQDFDICLCIGSSHGWLVMLDEKVDPYLFNPFMLAQIQLPPFETYPDVVRVSKSGNKFHVELPDSPPLGDKVLKFKSVKELRRRMILKAVLSSNPCHSDFFVLMILNLDGWDGHQVAFYHSRETKWMRIEDRLERYQGRNNYYTDFICYNDKFTALNGTSVEFWDVVDSSPIKRAEIRASVPRDLRTSTFYYKRYVVELFGELFLIEKLIDAYQNHSNIYKTSLFQIYKLDFTMNKWEEVDSLGDYALFLGGNQSKLISSWDIPEFEADSIYFSDDIWENWNGCDKDYDVGVFNMEDKSIKLYYQCKRKTVPPPFWIDPNSLLDA